MKRDMRIFILLALALTAAVFASVAFGSSDISLVRMIKSIFSSEGLETERLIFTSIRLPRMLAGLIAGIGLSLSGTVLQSVMDNPLASPNIIGVNAGAGLAVIVCLCAFPKAVYALPFAAFFGAVLTAALILSVAEYAGRNRTSVVLAGVACTALFQAFISFLSTLDTDVLSSYNAFSIGGFASVGLNELLLPGILVALCLIAALCLSGRITALTLGDGIAASLGVRVGLLRAACVMIACMSAAAVVGYAGLLGFVGLVVPHIARKICGGSIAKTMIAAALSGSAIVMLSDLAGRVLFAPAEISVGVIMAFIGAPFFFFLLVKGRGRTND